VKKIFISNDIPCNLIEALEKHGYSPRLLPGFYRLPSPVSSHCDMLIYDMGEYLLTYREYYEKNENRFDGIKVICSEKIPSEHYPNDIALNALKLNGKIYSLLSHTANEIIAAGLPVQNVKQGYARCSVCVVDSRTIITADSSIAYAAENDGIKVVRISAGDILLPGYGYGFIGGASFTDDGTVYFFGDLSMHPDGKKITAAIENCGKNVISLIDGQLCDFGGALVIT